MESDHREKVTSKKRRHWLRFTLIALTVVAGLVLVRQTYLFFYPQALINYQQFAPGKLPFDMKVPYHELYVWNDGISFFPHGASINLSQTGGVDELTIIESRPKNGLMQCRTYPHQTSNLTCGNDKTRKNTSYYWEVVRYQGRVTQEKVQFVLQSTAITIVLDKPHAQPLDKAEWAEVIDAFQPTTFSDLKVLRLHPGP